MPFDYCPWAGKVEVIFLELFPHPLELLIVRDRDRARKSALELARRVLHVSLHQALIASVIGTMVQVRSVKLSIEIS